MSISHYFTERMPAVNHHFTDVISYQCVTSLRKMPVVSHHFTNGRYLSVIHLFSDGGCLSRESKAWPHVTHTCTHARAPQHMHLVAHTHTPNHTALKAEHHPEQMSSSLQNQYIKTGGVKKKIKLVVLLHTLEYQNREFGKPSCGKLY